MEAKAKSEDSGAAPGAGVRVPRESQSPPCMGIGRVSPRSKGIPGKEDRLGVPGPGIHPRSADREGRPRVRQELPSSEEGDRPGTAGWGIPRELIPGQGAGSTQDGSR